MTAHDPRTVQVLVVEDNKVDRAAIRRGFRQHRIANPIVTAQDGVEALELMRDPASSLRRPYIVLLDLNMPRMDGFELLRELRADPALNDSVVFVLTTSKADEDKMAAYDLHVAGYICKSDVGAGFVRLIQLLDHYWRIVELPEHPR